MSNEMKANHRPHWEHELQLCADRFSVSARKDLVEGRMELEEIIRLACHVARMGMRANLVDNFDPEEIELRVVRFGEILRNSLQH